MEENQFFDSVDLEILHYLLIKWFLELYDTFLKYQHMVQIQRKINSD